MDMVCIALGTPTDIFARSADLLTAERYVSKCSLP